MHRVDFNQSHYNFQSSCIIETGLSDFHKMTVTVKETSYKKLKPRIINYRDYENFCDDTENINANCSGFEKFYKFASVHWTYLLLVRKNTYEEIICLS